VIRSVVFTWGC